MPSTVNGIGTWYYGKRNLIQRYGRCSACGKEGTLSSYDTKLYFVVLFIPIIPLSTKRVMDDCPHCRRHRVMSLADWEKLKVDLKRKMGEDLHSNPADEKKAKEAVHTLAALADRKGLEELTHELRKLHGEHAGVLAELGEAQAYLSMWGEAELSYRQALDVEPEHVNAREGLAKVLLSLNRPHDARPLLQHIVEKGEPDKVSLLYRLAECYQAVGEHSTALMVFDQCQALVPQLGQNKQYLKARRLSEKNLSSGKAIRSKARTPTLAASERDTSGRLARLTLPAIVAAGVLAWLGCAFYIGANRQVYLVNGLSEAYEVSINGAAPVKLAPARPIAVRVTEGQLNIETRSSRYKIPTARLTLETSFFSRPFNSPVFVINPDEVAIIEFHRAFYKKKGTSGEGQPEPQRLSHTNKLLHRFAQIDYPFQPVPNTISTSSNYGPISKTGLEVAETAKDGDMTGFAHLISQGGGKEALARNLQTRLGYEPERKELALLWSAYGRLDDLAKTLTPHLAKRPLEMDFHRAYQTCAEREGRGPEVLAQYRQMLQSEPQNADLMYLVARMLEDPDEVEAMLTQAIRTNPACGYAHYALAFHCMANAQFPQAFDEACRACELAKDNDHWAATKLEAAMAAGHPDLALKLFQQMQSKRREPGFSSIYTEAYLHGLAGNAAGIKQCQERIRSLVLREGNEDSAEECALVQDAADFAAGKCEQVLTRWENSPTLSRVSVTPLLYRDKLDQALQVFARKQEPSRAMLATMSVACLRGQRPQQAQEYLRRLCEQLAKDGTEERLFALALQGKPSMPVQKLARLSMEVDEKLPLLVLLGEIQPENRQVCWTLARQLNYDRRNGTYALYKKYLGE